MRWRLLIVAAAVLAGAGCGRQPRPGLVVYSAGPRPLAEALCKNFEESAGVRVELFSATTGQIMAKLEAERFRPRADVVILANQTAALGLKAAGRLLRYVPREIEGTHAGWHDPEGFFHATGAAVVGVAAREGMAGKFAWRGWRGILLEPAGVVMPSPSRSGTAGDFLMVYRQRHPATFWEDFLTARLGGLQIVGANSQAITGLMMGAYDAVYAAADYIICREIEKGERLEVGYPPEGAPYVLRPAAILATTRRAETARAFVDSLFRADAQREVAARHLLPARKDIELSAIRARFPVPEALPFDAAEAIREQKTLVRRFQYEIERAALRAGNSP